MSLTGTTRADSKRRAERRQAGAIRRSRIKAARGEERPLTLDDVFARAAGYCSICCLPVAREHASIEHVVPLAKGGLDVPGNQALAHMVCNSKKGARGPRRKGLRRTGLVAKPKRPELPDDVF